MPNHRSANPDCRLLLPLFLCLLAAPAFGQPAATCDGSQTLGPVTLPQNFVVGAGALSNDFTMTGTGCSEQGLDFVVCFTPESDCDLNIIECAYVPAGAATVSANIFEGPCTTTPTSCIDSGAGANFGAAFASLTAGTEYCVVCETTVAVTTLVLDLDVDSGSCGLLPVELEHFSISQQEAAEDAAPAEEAAD